METVYPKSLPKILNAAIVACMLLFIVLISAVPSNGQVIGYRDFSFAGGGPSPTSDKPQNKLWWNDGIWWGCLYNPLTSAYDIYKLDWSSQTWWDMGVTVDTRKDAHMDTLWDGQSLYIVSGSPRLATPC